MNLEQLKKDVAGFVGTFSFEPAHTLDRGIGNVADFVDIDDRLVYVPDDAENEEDHHAIAEPIEEHVAEPIARMLNAVPGLLSLYEAAEGIHQALVVTTDVNDNKRRFFDAVEVLLDALEAVRVD